MATLAADTEQALIDALEFIEPYVDVVDGDYGYPAPNRAMTVAESIRDVLARLDRQRAVDENAASLATMGPLLAAISKTDQPA